MSEERKVVGEYKAVRQDYEWDASIFNDEPERVARVKEIIATRLTEPERILFIMYTDCGSLRLLARRLGLSHTTLNSEIRRIRNIILTEYYKTAEKK